MVCLHWGPRSLGVDCASLNSWFPLFCSIFVFVILLFMAVEAPSERHVFAGSCGILFGEMRECIFWRGHGNELALGGKGKAWHSMAGQGHGMTGFLFIGMRT